MYWLSFRYGKGFGIVRHIFGEDSVLNQPNSLGGMLFYCVLIVLSKYGYRHKVHPANEAQATEPYSSHSI